MRKFFALLVFLGLFCSRQALALTPGIPAPVTISSPGVDASSAMSLLMDGGIPLAIWVENGVVTSRYLSGQDWSSPPDVLSGLGSSSPVMSADTTGNVVAVWVENGVIHSSTRSFASGTWSTPSDALSDTGASLPRIAVDPNGNAVAVWTRNGTIEASTRLSGGAWSTVTVLSGANADRASIIIDSSGNATAAWTQIVGGISSIYAASQPLKGVWTTASQVSSANVNSQNVRLASFSNGKVAAVWYRYAISSSNYSNVVVQYATWSSGTGWTTPIDLSEAGRMDPAKLIARVRTDSNGNVYAFWTTSFDGAQIIIETANAAAGQNFSAPMDLIVANPYVYSFSSPGEGGGSQLVLWMSFDDPSSSLIIQAIYHTDTGNWTSAVTTSLDGQNAYPSASMMKDSNYIYFTAIWLNYTGGNTVAQASYFPMPRVQPPSAPAVVQITNNYTVVSEVSNVISWTVSPTSNVNLYRIYRNGILITQVASSVFSFEDYNQVLNGSVTYEISAVDTTGAESDKVLVSFP